MPEAGEWRPVAETGFKCGKYAVYVWRSVREDGDTKTEKSRRPLEIPDDAARALKEHHAEQAKQKLGAGKVWQDNDLVGHRTTIVTQKVYRHQLKPVISTGATAMNAIFGNKKPPSR